MNHYSILTVKLKSNIYKYMHSENIKFEGHRWSLDRFFFFSSLIEIMISVAPSGLHRLVHMVLGSQDVVDE